MEKTIIFKLCFVSLFEYNGLNDPFDIKWNIV